MIFNHGPFVAVLWDVQPRPPAHPLSNGATLYQPTLSASVIASVNLSSLIVCFLSDDQVTAIRPRQVNISLIALPLFLFIFLVAR
jgi:hypothetical protein